MQTFISTRCLLLPRALGHIKLVHEVNKASLSFNGIPPVTAQFLSLPPVLPFVWTSGFPLKWSRI